MARNYPRVYEADLPTVSYEDASTPEAAHAALKEARRQFPIAMGAHGPEILSYELAHTALRDHRLITAPGMGLEAQGITSGALWDRVSAVILCVNGEDHARLRRLVVKAFTSRSVARLETTIVDIITQLVDPLVAQGRCDIVADIARPYPVPVICELLGASRDDWQLFSAWADEFFKAFTWNAADHQPGILKAWSELDDHVDKMVAERRTSPTDDLITELIRAEDDGNFLSMAELRMLVGSLLMAGTDTTRNQVAACVEALCDHPDQWDLLAEQPTLAMKAVEELMRFYPVTTAARRITTEDVEYEGVMLPADTFLSINTAAANRDPDVYQDPDRLDIMREGAAPMQTFGAGAHYCLGANLARCEIAQALVVMSGRMRNMHRVGQAPWKPMVGISGPTMLRVEFDAR